MSIDPKDYENKAVLVLGRGKYFVHLVRLTVHMYRLLGKSFVKVGKIENTQTLVEQHYISSFVTCVRRL